jgi:hypothetical protein
MQKRKVHFDIVIPDELDTCPSDDESDDPDFIPGIDEEDCDPYEYTPLTDAEKDALQLELEQLVEDQDLELDIEWDNYNQNN